ncbi:MAG: oligoendopeptidase F family protein, partial [Tissierellia bacterium]|nr:oligoendopeptidase F family protein [Tissierellia bacterium]
LEGDQEALEKYINFLKDGGNNFPLDQLKAAGADISKKETINEAMEVFKELVDELEELIQ